VVFTYLSEAWSKDGQGSLGDDEPGRIGNSRWHEESKDCFLVFLYKNNKGIAVESCTEFLWSNPE
jgi:hypothetical protein